MSVVRTDRWLDESFFEPEKICNKFSSFIKGENGEQIYEFLVQKGMYRPSSRTLANFNQLKKDKIWDFVGRMATYYRKKWNGPNVPIYIFPSRDSLFDSTYKRVGFTFPNQIFLFLSPSSNKKEIQALFIHEYHHATRLKKIAKPIEKNTLLDSLIMEGLAEMAVCELLGETYVSKWNFNYNEKLLETYWKEHYLPQINVKISDPLHDELLYGRRFSKPFLGYAIGYYLVDLYKKEHTLPLSTTFTIPAEKFINKQ